MTSREGNEGNPSVAPAESRGRTASLAVARVLAVLLAVMFVGFGADQVFAQQGLIYSPCWTKDECLNLNGTPGSSAVQQAGLGECANGRCFCNNASCYDPHRQETACTGGQGKCFANPPPVPLTIAIGGAVTTLDIGDYIAKVYNYGVTIAGILAGVMFVVGGFQYLTAGNSGRVAKAKERIKDAIIGLLLVLGAYVILNTINPDVLSLQMPKVPLVKKKLYVACQYFSMQKPCGQPFTLVKIPGTDSLPISQQYRVAQGGAADQGSTSTTSCIGMSCSRAGGDDATQRCKIPPNTPTSASVNAPAPSTAACAAQPVAPYQCLPCFEDDHDCTGSGPSQDCCGGFCVSATRTRAATGEFGAAVGASGYSGTGSSFFAGKCSNGANGTRCATDAECFSHHCADTHGQIGGTCTSGLESAPCDADKDCEGGRVCIETTGIHVCSTPWYLSACVNNADCGSTGLTCQQNRCVPPNYGSFGIEPCDNNTQCDAAHMAGGTVNGVFGTMTVPDNSRFGEFFCWTQASHIFSSDTKFCKPIHFGVVCHVGEYECGAGNFCYDGAIGDRAIISPSAGICTTSAEGSGCDPGNDGQCSGGGSNPRGKCDAMPHWVINNTGICTYKGTAGVPCLPDGEQGTCDSGLRCPATVKRCVLPPGCPPGS